MKKDTLLKKLTILDFMSVDLSLYLNTHPEDAEALRKYNCVVDEADKVRCAYEKMYGPLCSYRTVNNGKWAWIDNPWPWDEEFNCVLEGER